ncbi:hypothetical protein [Bacillus cereus]
MNRILEKEINNTIMNLMAITTGFWASKTLATAVEIEIFNNISKEE